MSPANLAPKRAAARAIADVSTGIILATVEIAAPPARVFEALTRAEDVTKWWGSPEMYQTTAYTADLRAGGRYRSSGKGADGSEFFVEGEFLVVDAPRKLVHTWEPSWEPGSKTTVSYSLEPIESGTRVTVRHDGFAAGAPASRDHAMGWERVLGWLDGYLLAPDPRPHFVMKLIHSRKTFPFDMTDEERAMMMAHQKYWRGHLDAGTSLLFGPVNDPNGVYGLGIVRVDNTEQLAELQANDPAIAANKGLRYEVAPLMRVVTRL